MSHGDYDADRIDGFDYDIDSILVKVTSVIGESALTEALQAWDLEPEQFLHPVANRRSAGATRRAGPGQAVVANRYSDTWNT